MGMQYNNNEVKAGAVILAAATIFFIFLFSISGIGLKKDKNIYRARFVFTKGIQSGSLVRVGGLLVGKVDKVYFPEDDNTRIEVTVSVDASAPVRVDSRASITAMGIMGDYYIEISPGTMNAAALESGEMIQSFEAPSFTQMGENLAGPIDRITVQIEEMLIGLNAVLDKKNVSHISSMIASIDTILLQNEDNASVLATNLTSLTVELHELTEHLNKMMKQNEESFTTAITQFNSSMMRAESLMVGLAHMSNEVNYLIRNNEVSLGEVLLNLKDASRNFETFTRKVKIQPWSLIRKSAAPERKFKTGSQE